MVVLRLASRSLQLAAFLHICAHANVLQRALARAMTQHALAARARRTALVGVGLCLMKAHYAIEITLLLDARHCSDMPVAV